tara:strand:+ start:210 stop:455 length:246 start_codon:yes stop_codon:yes gene_type:complete
MSKVTTEQYIKDLEHDKFKLTDMVVELKDKIEELELKIEQMEQDYYFDMRNKTLEIHSVKEQMKQIVLRVPSKYLTGDNND